MRNGSIACEHLVIRSTKEKSIIKAQKVRLENCEFFK